MLITFILSLSLLHLTPLFHPRPHPDSPFGILSTLVCNLFAHVVLYWFWWWILLDHGIAMPTHDNGGGSTPFKISEIIYMPTWSSRAPRCERENSRGSSKWKRNTDNQKELAARRSAFLRNHAKKTESRVPETREKNPEWKQFKLIRTMQTHFIMIIPCAAQMRGRRKLLKPPSLRYRRKCVHAESRVSLEIYRKHTHTEKEKEIYVCGGGQSGLNKIWLQRSKASVQLTCEQGNEKKV